MLLKLKQKEGGVSLTESIKELNSTPMIEMKCLLCLENFIKGEKVVFLPCFAAFEDKERPSKNFINGLDRAHFLHYECLKIYFNARKRCPVC